jgi:hypothetical protein
VPTASLRQLTIRARVLAASDSFATDNAVFLTSVPMHGVVTVYAVIGDSFAYLSILGLIVLMGVVLFCRRGGAPLHER